MALYCATGELHVNVKKAVKYYGYLCLLRDRRLSQVHLSVSRVEDIMITLCFFCDLGSVGHFHEYNWRCIPCVSLYKG